MKILITGGCGFVGSNLAIYFKNNQIGTKINTLDNLSRKGSSLNLVRLKNQITKADDVKIKSNYNIWTGKGEAADVDLDSEETRELADDFLNPTGVEFGRSKHKGRSHRLYKVLDLDKKKHTRKAYTFRDNPDDTTIIELRAHNHYTMCSGSYDDGDTAIFNKSEKPAEITWDQLLKQVAMTGVAAVMLRKASKVEM